MHYSELHVKVGINYTKNEQTYLYQKSSDDNAEISQY